MSAQNNDDDTDFIVRRLDQHYQRAIARIKAGVLSDRYDYTIGYATAMMAGSDSDEMDESALDHLNSLFRYNTVRRELLASLPKEVPQEVKPLIKVMKEVTPELEEAGIGEEAPTIFHARRYIQEMKRKVTLISTEDSLKALKEMRKAPPPCSQASGITETELCAIVSDLWKLEIKTQWVVKEEYQQLQRGLQERLVPFYHSRDRVWDKTESYKVMDEAVQEFLSPERQQSWREFQQARQNPKYKIIPLLSATIVGKNTIYLLENVKATWSHVFLDLGQKQVAMMWEKEGENMYKVHSYPIIFTEEMATAQRPLREVFDYVRENET